MWAEIPYHEGYFYPTKILPFLVPWRRTSNLKLIIFKKIKCKLIWYIYTWKKRGIYYIDHIPEYFCKNQINKCFDKLNIRIDYWKLYNFIAMLSERASSLIVIKLRFACATKLNGLNTNEQSYVDNRYV